MRASVTKAIIQAPCARIRVRPGRRPVDLEHVANLAVSIGEIGQRQAISIRRMPDDATRGEHIWELVAGNHRLSAVMLLGRDVIDAVVEDETELDARIAEVDENLIRRELNYLERAQAISGRLEAWAAKNPDRVVSGDGQLKPKRGRPSKLPHGAAISDVPATMGFAAETAKAASLSRDSVERAIAIYRGLSPTVQGQLAGTVFAENDAALRQLAGIADHQEQAAVVKELLTGGRTKNVSDARAYAAGNEPMKAAPTPVDLVLKGFKALWTKASPSARTAILDFLEGQKLPGKYSVTAMAPAAPAAEVLFSLKVGDLVSTGGSATGYRLLAQAAPQVRDGAACPTFMAQAVRLSTGKDHGSPQAVALDAIKGVAPTVKGGDNV